MAEYGGRINENGPVSLKEDRVTAIVTRKNR